MTKRCFLGIKVRDTNQYSDHLSQIKKNLNVKVSLSNFRKYHLTIHFFGDIEENSIKLIDNKLNDLTYTPFSLIFKYPGSFPKNRLNKTRVLFIASIVNQQLNTLINEVYNLLEPLEIYPPNRQFNPHLTIGRVRSGKDVGRLAQIWNDSKFNEIKIEVTTMKLFESILSNTGTKYEILSEYNSSND